jgi:hypothetical protein
MGRPRKYLSFEEAQEANRIKTRERKKERNRLRRDARLAIAALQAERANQPDLTTYHTDSRELSMDSTTEPEPESSDERAIAEQLVQPPIQN